MTLQIVASLIDATRGVIYNHHMFIVQATGQHKELRMETKPEQAWTQPSLINNHIFFFINETDYLLGVSIALTKVLYYKTFHGCNLFCFVISQSVCHCQSLPP